MPPIVDFDVLFLPDTFRALGQIAPALVYADVRNVQLLGPATWRNAQLLNRAGHYLEKALFVDSFATERQSRVTRDFVEKFEKTKGRLPSSFAAQGFDVGSALKQAYSGGRTPQNRDDLRSRLANLGSFDGVMGMQTWDARREALSEMQLFEIRKSNFQHLGGITIRPRKD
jgi:ABC-type branched-subunit amino acid transport system substrate-binding protein